MDLFNTNIPDAISKPESELVEREKMEYTLLGTFYRTKGLKLFTYNPKTEDIKELLIKRKTGNINQAIKMLNKV